MGSWVYFLFFFLLWVIVQYYFIYFGVQIIPALATGLPCPFDIPLHRGFSFEHFLTFFITRCSRLILYISCPCPRISHLSKEPYFLVLENGIKHLDLRAQSAYCYWGVLASQPSQQTVQRKVSVYWSVYIHITVNVSVWNHLNVC